MRLVIKRVQDFSTRSLNDYNLNLMLMPSVVLGIRCTG